MYIKYNILCRLFASDYKKGYNMNMKIENLIKERIEDNKKLFTQQEYDNISENIDTYIKVYLLALLDNNT
jgi:hypothetical protein